MQNWLCANNNSLFTLHSLLHQGNQALGTYYAM